MHQRLEVQHGAAHQQRYAAARLHLAEVFIAKKQPELAKRELDSLLAAWAKVDRASVPVVERARKLRTSLR